MLRKDGSVEKGEFFATLLTGNWRFYRTRSGNWRDMTPREGARGQGFADTFPLPEDEVVARSLICRSEPPPMARAVGQSLVDWPDATNDLWVGYPNGLVPVTAESRMAGAYKSGNGGPLVSAELRWFFRKTAIKVFLRRMLRIELRYKAKMVLRLWRLEASPTYAATSLQGQAGAQTLEAGCSPQLQGISGDQCD